MPLTPNAWADVFMRMFLEILLETYLSGVLRGPYYGRTVTRFDLELASAYGHGCSP